MWTCPIGMMTPQHHHLGRIRTDMRLEGLRMSRQRSGGNGNMYCLGTLQLTIGRST